MIIFIIKMRVNSIPKQFSMGMNFMYVGIIDV